MRDFAKDAAPAKQALKVRLEAMYARQGKPVRVRVFPDSAIPWCYPQGAINQRGKPLTFSERMDSAASTETFYLTVEGRQERLCD